VDSKRAVLHGGLPALVELGLGQLTLEDGHGAPSFSKSATHIAAQVGSSCRICTNNGAVRGIFKPVRIVRAPGRGDIVAHPK
jgi:hypothetical protein